MSNEATDFLFGGGGKAAKFEEVGDMVEGIIVGLKKTQQTSMEDGSLLFWPNGDPREQLVISLQTEAEGEDDDGIRNVYAKGGTYKVASGSGTSMKQAVADALKRAKATSIDEGGTLKVAFTGMGEKTNRGYSAPKLFTAKYTAPKASVAATDLFDD